MLLFLNRAKSSDLASTIFVKGITIHEDGLKQLTFQFRQVSSSSLQDGYPRISLSLSVLVKPWLKSSIEQVGFRLSHIDFQTYPLFIY